MLTDPEAGPAARPSGPLWGLAVLPVLVFALVFALASLQYQGQTLARGPDQADMLLAFFNEASHAIEEEGLLAAMYTEGVRAGESNWSNPNYHMLYPLYFNWAGADATPAATLDRLNLIVLLHLALLGSGAYALARSLGLGVGPALVVGLAIPWFPAVRSAAGWPHIIAGMAWIPWLLAAQVRIHRGGDWHTQLPAAAGLVVAATMLAHAHPAQNMVFAACASFAIWLLVGAQVLVARDRVALRQLARGSIWLGLSALVVLALCWPWLREILAFHARSIRWLGEVGGFLVGDQPVPVHALRHHALAAADAVELVAFRIRPGIGHAYIGAAVAVAALGVLSRSLAATTQARCARAMLACGLLATAFCFAPLAPLLAMLPLAGKVRELSWWSCLAVLLLVPLVPLGLQAMRLRAGMPARWRTPWPWLVVAGSAIAAAATLGSDAPWRPAALLALVPAFAALAWALWARRGGQAALTAACALLLGATVWTPLRHNIRFPYADAMLFHPDRVQAHADAAALAARLDGLDRYRFVIADAVDNAHLLTHAWTMHGFRSIHGGIGPTEYAKYMLLSQANPTVAALYGVRWSIQPASAARPGDMPLRPGLVLRTHDEALSRLFLLSGGVEVVDDPVEHLRHIGDASPLRAAVRRGDLPPGADARTLAGAGRPGGHVALRRNDRTRLEATIEADGPGLLVLNEDPAARWRATLDGERTRLFRVNGYQTALYIPAAGRYEVRITRPGHLFGGS